MSAITDRHAIDGKLPAPDERFDVVVVGAGSVGTAAAIRAATEGARVLLIDENPVPGGLIGTDVPLFFGGRATAAVQQPARMVEQLFAANPLLEAAFEAGVDVRLGTAAWGLYVNGPALRALPAPMLGIADAERAAMIGYDRLVLATGARDLMLGFPGWNQPGVMGARGFATLLLRYDALASRRIMVVGSDTLGLETALLALSAGIAVAGIVEIADAAQGPAALVAELEAAGVPFFLGHTIAATRGGIDGVEGVTLAPVPSPAEAGAQSRDAFGETLYAETEDVDTGPASGRTVPRTVLERAGYAHPDAPSPGKEGVVEIACDTIVLAIGVTPATELLDASGATLNDTISAVGDAATAHPPAPERLQAWAAALATYAAPDTIVCQCEEVTRADLLGVQPPHYLDRPEKMGARSLSSLLNDGPAHPDQIKRLTRAGMGQCQGRRCRDQVACLLAEQQGVPLGAVPVASFRAPVRPVPLAILADWQESADMARGWDVWFGIPTQWTPYAIIGTPEEAEHVAGLGGNMHV